MDAEANKPKFESENGADAEEAQKRKAEAEAAAAELKAKQQKWREQAKGPDGRKDGPKDEDHPPIELLKRLANPEKIRRDWKNFGLGPGANEKAKTEAPPHGIELPIFNPEDLTQVPGVVGRLTDWIEEASLYPNRRLALGAALVIVGTMMGQRVAGPTHSSTHLYVVGISGSSSGKQDLTNCVKEALSEIGAGVRIGPGDFRSSVGLINELREHSCFCSPMDEYGLVLQRITNKGAGGFEQDIVSVLQQLWGHNWTWYHSPAAAREKSQAIFAPALSILGVSVPEQFYGAVKFKQIAGGLLNRHLIIRGDDHPRLRTRADGAWKLPTKLKEELRALYKPGKKSAAAAFEPEIIMPWGSAGAERVWIELAAKLREEPDTLRSNLFSRVPEQMIRIANIEAFGRYSPTVDQADMEWASALAMESGETLHHDVLKYTIDLQDLPGLCQKILELVTANGGWMGRRDLRRGCQNLPKKGGDLDGAIGFLMRAERIKEEERPTGGRPSPGYALCE
jgi:hypothetical protein